MNLKKIFKKISVVDIVIIFTVVIALVVGYLTFAKVRQTSAKQIVSTSPVEFHVFVRGLSYTGVEFPVKRGEKTFITIRNVPYTELEVKDVMFGLRQIGVMTNQGYKTIDDPAYPNLYDLVVVVNDDAKITKDGPVVGGNKLKTGLPITIEGATYKFNGTVSDVIIMNKPQG